MHTEKRIEQLEKNVAELADIVRELTKRSELSTMSAWLRRTKQ